MGRYGWHKPLVAVALSPGLRYFLAEREH